MRKFFALAILMLSGLAALSQKQIYIPDEWKWQGERKLYAESDPEREYTWSKSRMVENDDIAVFWDNGYECNPSELASSNFYYVDIDDLLRKCQSFYDLEYNELGFVNPAKTNLNKYKMMVLISHTETWTCYGGGYDYEVNALWINPATCKPVGFAVAHEVGHSFHYMCYSDATGNSHTSSSTIGTGFHLPLANGQAIWEQTAQWQAAQSYPQDMFKESIGVFRHSHNYAFSHEWHRYQSYWFHYFLCQHYGDIKTVADVWNQPMTGPVDFNQSLMKLKSLKPADLYKLYFDYSCRCVTWDFEACKPYRDSYIGDFDYRCVLNEDGSYQVALASCPQSTGFNVIPLQVPEAGAEVSVSLTSVRVGEPLPDADPGEYYKDGTYEKLTARKYVSNSMSARRGYRMGFVALMEDGTRRYYSEDMVYCQGATPVTEDYAITVPEGVSRLWLVVSPALKTYYQHQWDEDISTDDMWPYCFRLEGTDLDAHATVYAAPTIDGRDLADITFTYDVTFPRTTGSDHSGTTVSLSGQALATLCTAFQLQPVDFSGKMQTWSSSGPSVGKMMFYAVTPSGRLASSGSTANGYGHWFNASGSVVTYSSGSSYVYSEFNASALSFALGQYPARCTTGKTYTIRQALRYRKSSQESALATFVFNITVGPAASVSLRSMEYENPGYTPMLNVQRSMLNVQCSMFNVQRSMFDLSGCQVVNGKGKNGIYVKDGKKVIIRQ